MEEDSKESKNLNEPGGCGLPRTPSKCSFVKTKVRQKAEETVITISIKPLNETIIRVSLGSKGLRTSSGGKNKYAAEPTLDTLRFATLFS